MRREMNSRSPISGLESPAVTRSTTRSSAGVRLAQPDGGRGGRLSPRKASAVASSSVSAAPAARSGAYPAPSASRARAVASSNRARADGIGT